MLLPDKAKAIKHIAVHTNKKQLGSCIRAINYHRDMKKDRSDIFTHLTKMTSKQATWN